MLRERNLGLDIIISLFCLKWAMRGIVPGEDLDRVQLFGPGVRSGSSHSFSYAKKRITR